MTDSQARALASLWVTQDHLLTKYRVKAEESEYSSEYYDSIARDHQIMRDTLTSVAHILGDLQQFWLVVEDVQRERKEEG